MADLPKSELLALTRAYQSRNLEHKATQAACALAATGFGIIRGFKWIWRPQDRARIKQYLEHALDIENADHFHADFGRKTRIETAAIISEEKYAGLRPRAGNVLIRGFCNRVRINGSEWGIIGQGSQDVPVDDIHTIEHDCILTVENYEAYKHSAEFKIRDFPFKDPLILYRGDPINMTDASRRLLTKLDKPVVAFTDFDAHGFNIASSLPNLIGAIFPSDLSGLNRNDLFARQRILLGETIKYPAPWHDLIEAMKDARQGMTQEHMYAHNVPFLYLPVRNGAVLMDRRHLGAALQDGAVP